MRLCHAKVLPLQQKSGSIPHWSLHQPQKEKRKGARVAEEARLESVYTSKAYRGFESPSLRTESCKSKDLQDFYLMAYFLK